MLRVVWLRILVSLMVLFRCRFSVLFLRIFRFVLIFIVLQKFFLIIFIGGVVSVNVTITDEFISVNAVYPLDIRFKDGKGVVKVLNFNDVC